MALVSAEALEVAAIVSAEAHLDAAIALAQDTGRGFPAAEIAHVPTLTESGRDFKA